MKKHIYSIALFVSLAIPVLAQVRSSAKLTFQIVDGARVPIPGADISISTFDHSIPFDGLGEAVDAILKKATDDRGQSIFMTSSLTGEFSYFAKKHGYYDQKSADYQFVSSEDGRWVPWNPTIEIKLHQVRNPIPLYARNVGVTKPLKLPLLGKPAGFDLVVSDWIAPNGSGMVPDLIFEEDGATNNLSKPYKAKLTISFSNPDDGIVKVGPGDFQGCELQMPYLAPVDGYQSNLVLNQSSQVNPESRPPMIVINDSRPWDSFYLRLRTRTDGHGKIVSANYCKIYGGARYGGFHWYVNGSVRFQYFFNPTVNDRNLEFDRNRNLLKVIPGESVVQP